MARGLEKGFLPNLVDVGLGDQELRQIFADRWIWISTTINHNKQTCKMFANNNRAKGMGKRVSALSGMFIAPKWTIEDMLSSMNPCLCVPQQTLKCTCQRRKPRAQEPKGILAAEKKKMGADQRPQPLGLLQAPSLITLARMHPPGP